MLHRSQNISVSLAAHLERLIATGALPPGSRLPAERDLARTMSVSRASLREAMHELETKNLIERRPGRGTTVLERSAAVEELLGLSGGASVRDNAAELRLVVEPSVAALAATRATASNLLQLQEVLDRTTPDLRATRSLELDIEFHLLLAHAARNPLLTTLHTLMTEWTMEVRRLSHSTARSRRHSAQGHAEILRAVRAQDAGAAREAMERHLDDVRGLIEGC
nr:FCD domain-containing protein [Nakamurella flavida]